MEKVSNLSELSNIQHGFYNRHDFDTVKEPVLMTQVHSADVLILDNPLDTKPQVDALVTDKAGINLTVKTADCAPVLFADAEHHVIGATHAGWKGAFQGIIENTILEMIKLGANISTIVAAVGPCLHKESFIVQPDFKALFPITEHKFFSEENGKIHFDFLAYVVHRLYRAGIKNVRVVDIDTYTNANYFSYRKEPENPGRQYSQIMMIK